MGTGLSSRTALASEPMMSKPVRRVASTVYVSGSMRVSTPIHDGGRVRGNSAPDRKKMGSTNSWMRTPARRAPPPAATDTERAQRGDREHGDPLDARDGRPAGALAEDHRRSPRRRDQHFGQEAVLAVHHDGHRGGDPGLPWQCMVAPTSRSRGFYSISVSKGSGTSTSIRTHGPAMPRPPRKAAIPATASFARMSRSRSG